MASRQWNASGGNKVQNLSFKYKGQGLNVIYRGVIWKRYISWVFTQNMKYLSLTVQQLWSRLKGFATVTDRQSDRQADAPESIQGAKKIPNFTYTGHSIPQFWEQ